MNHERVGKRQCIIRWFCIFLILASEIQAFVPQNTRRNYQRTISLADVSPVEPTATPTNEEEQYNEDDKRARRFHQDMIRVLETRKQNSNDDENVSSLSRRHRPSLIKNDKDGAERVLSMLQHMVEVGVATETSFQICMDAFLKRGRLRWKDKKSSEHPIICAADQLETLLQQLECRDQDVSVETYNRVLQAYAICSTPRGDRNYAKRASVLLERMQDQDTWNVDSLVHTLHAWAWQQANLQASECAQRAQELLDEILDNNLLENDDALLMQCYNFLLEAWSKSKGSPERADAIFSTMKQLNATSNTNCGLPNAESYSNAILAWTKSTTEGSPERAHELLEEMIQRFEAGAFPPSSEPELISFNGCIMAWARIGRLDKAESILWELNRIAEKCDRLVPDVITYNSVLHAHVKSRDKKTALSKAIALVDYMEEHCQLQPAIAPDSFTYNTLMKAWVQSGDPEAPEQAEAILAKMEKLGMHNEKVELTNRNFNVVINAYAKSKDRMAASKAHRLLKRMEESQHVQPDIISYTTVMECYAKSSDPNAPVVAFELLDRAFERYENTNDKAVMPNARTFTMAIQALAQCPRQGNVVKARGLLERLTKLYETTGNESLRPTEYAYNYVINCAANTIGTTEEKIQAFQLATRTYQEMRNSNLVKPDSFTFAFWIKACNNLLPRSAELHTKCVSFAFEQCKSDGLVTNEVLNRLQQGSSREVVEQLLGVDVVLGYGGNLQVCNLPPVWSRNTRRRTMRQRR